MKCYYCGDKMKKGKTVYTINRDGWHFLMDKVASWNCDQCGQALLEEKEVKAIQNLTKILDAAMGKTLKLRLRHITGK